MNCGGGSTKEKKTFQYHRVQKMEKVSSVESGKTAIDLENKGIGPISDF